MIDRERFLELVEKHLDHNCSEAEEAELEEYYQTYGQLLFVETSEQKTKQQLYSGVSAQIKKSNMLLAQKRKRRTMLRIAASISILIALGITSLLLLPQKQVELITVVSNLGEKKEVTLPDSSLVTLNAGSSFTYPESFNGNTREVQLNGEAFFKVTHDPQKPFLVTASKLSTRVLGTSFNIKAYDDGPEIKISLATGSIQISKADRIMATLKPDEQLRYNKTTSDCVIETHSTNNDISWLDNIIKLNDHSLEETVRIVERWFNVKLHVVDKKSDAPTITGRFIDPTLEETIQSLELLTGSKIIYETQVEP
ncbi:FecR family protein [Flagellimonas hadalis]|uniref:DUF4974 domain-containing protein n=1 Tax=Flagellimonas hadalis TaxID=2597517 RepID=A0A5N5ISC5_9FLAO|nr:FecR domain-containing protein [Allomuricauda hadalis]KAB5491441.1 DUF4974 domain-containing protein [Allomuricauda hadalis]